MNYQKYRNNFPKKLSSAHTAQTHACTHIFTHIVSLNTFTFSTHTYILSAYTIHIHDYICISSYELKKYMQNIFVVSRITCFFGCSQTGFRTNGNPTSVSIFCHLLCICPLESHLTPLFSNFPLCKRKWKDYISFTKLSTSMYEYMPYVMYLAHFLKILSIINILYLYLKFI